MLDYQSLIKDIIVEGRQNPEFRTLRANVRKSAVCTITKVLVTDGEDLEFLALEADLRDTWAAREMRNVSSLQEDLRRIRIDFTLDYNLSEIDELHKRASRRAIAERLLRINLAEEQGLSRELLSNSDGWVELNTSLSLYDSLVDRQDKRVPVGEVLV